MGPGEFKTLGSFELRRAGVEVRDSNYRMYLPDRAGMRGGRGSPLHKLLLDPGILAVASELIRGPVLTLKAQGALLLERGTQQALHDDTWYGLGGAARGGMVGFWFALDNADDDNGPVVYVRGSHRGRR